MFQGFTQETVDFMWGIRFNNERGWFLEHKEDYQKHLLEPVKALGEDIYKGVKEMLPREPLMLKTSRNRKKSQQSRVQRLTIRRKRLIKTTKSLIIRIRSLHQSRKRLRLLRRRALRNLLPASAE